MTAKQATFFGFKVQGIIGALVATIGIFTPSLAAIILSIVYLLGWKKDAIWLILGIICVSLLLF